MTEVRFVMNIKALASMMNTTIDGLAEIAGLNGQHLRDVSAGRVTMTARDLINLHKATNVPCEQIQIDY